MAPKKKYYRKANSSHTNTGILNLINQNNQKFIDLTMEAVDTFLMEYDLTQVKFNAVSVNTSMLKKELYKLLVVRSRDGNYSKSIVNMAYKYVTDMSFKDYVGAYILHTEEKAVKFKEEKPQLFAQQLRDGTLRLLRRYEVMAKDRYDLLIQRNIFTEKKNRQFDK